MALVAGVDSSTQSCKVVVCDADTGAVVRSGSAPHPDGTEVDPEAWWVALEQAARAAGGLDDVVAVSVAAQQHGMVCLDEAGHVVRPALLWNDTRSAAAADELVAELGATAWAAAIGSVPVASFTIAKLRWLAEHEPESLARTAAVCLPHDWLTWRLLGAPGVDALVTDRGDASGSGWWSPIDGRQRADLLALATGRSLQVPNVLGPDAVAGVATCLAPGARVGAGTGDNMGAALGLAAVPGDAVVSIGTSGVAAAISEIPARDPSGIVAGFADATGRFLPLACTLNAARTLDGVASLLGRAQEPPPDRKPVDVEALVEEVHETLALAESRIGWIASIERGMIVDADPDQLLRVLLNLARNAVQALETRGPNDPARDQVRITGRREGSVAVIEVSDTGPGFPARAREHLFEAFQTTARSGGTGLGLAIAAELVRAHGGEIKLVEGTIGATFRLTIPDRAVELDARRSARARA